MYKFLKETTEVLLYNFLIYYKYFHLEASVRLSDI